MTALPGSCSVHRFAPICDVCQLRPTCPISVDPRQCAALERDDAIYHAHVNEEEPGE